MRAIRIDGWKYHLRLPGFDLLARDGRTVRMPEELFHVARDPAERANLVARPEARETLGRLQRELRRYREEIATRILPPPAGADGPRAQAAPRREPADGTTLYHLLANGDAGDHRFRGEVRVAGEIRSIRPVRLAARSGVWRDGGRVLVDLRVERRATGFVLEVSPAAEVVLTGELDGKPLSVDRVFVGRYGLAVASPATSGFRLDGLATIDARRAPPFREGGELGLFVWRSGVRARAARGEVSVTSGDRNPELDSADLPVSDDGANRDVERALREWGYIQRGEREPKR